MIATTPMIAKASLQISLTLGIRRSLSIARRLPRWATDQSAVFLAEPEEGERSSRGPEAHPTPSCAAVLDVMLSRRVGVRDNWENSDGPRSVTAEGQTTAASG